MDAQTLYIFAALAQAATETGMDYRGRSHRRKLLYDGVLTPRNGGSYCMPQVGIEHKNGLSRNHFMYALLALLLCLAGIAPFTHSAHAAAPKALEPCAISIAPGTMMTCAISTAAEVDSITLTGTSGEIYLFRVAITAGDMRPLVRVHAPDGTKICEVVSSYYPGAEIARCVLTQDGTQTIMVSDTAATRSGNYNLYVQRLTGPVGATALEVGATHPNVISAGAEATTFTLAGTANEVYVLRMGVTAGELRPGVRVFSPSGTEVCAAIQSYYPGAEIARCVLPQDGTFTVLAADSAAVKTGSYNLYLQRLTSPVGATALAVGATHTATIQAGSEGDTYTLIGTANEVYLVRMGVTAGELRPSVRVFSPSGTEVCAALQSYAPGAEIARCVLPQDGTFTVLAADSAVVKTGSYNLYLQRLTAPTHARVIVAGETLVGAISVSAEADTFRWSAGASDRLRVTVTTTNGALRPGVRVFDSAGTKVCEALSSYSATVEIADCLLPRSGLYTVLVGDSSAILTGVYRVALTCLSRPCGAAYTAVVGPEGGTIHAGELQIDIPPGAFAESTTIQITPQLTTAVPGAGVQRVIRSFAILAFRAGNSTITTAAKPLIYTEHHADLDLSTQGIAASDLRLAFWDTTAQSWTTVTEGSAGVSLSASTTTIADIALVMTATSQQRVYLPLLRR